MANDVYDDPDNILANDDDTVDGSVAAPANNGDLSQSIEEPERHTTDKDDREGIPELDEAGRGDELQQPANPDLDDSETGSDAYQLGDVQPAEESDGDEA